MENLHSAAEAETPLTPSTDAVPPAEDHALATLPDTAAESAPETVVESALDEAVSEAEAGELAEGADAAKAKVKTLHPRAVLNILADRYPAAFHADGRLVKPLAVGVLQELRAVRGRGAFAGLHAGFASRLALLHPGRGLSSCRGAWRCTHQSAGRARCRSH